MEHSRISPSGFHRVLRCPASPRMEEQFPGEVSAAAEEGTAAHMFAEAALKGITEGWAIDTRAFLGHDFNGHIVDEMMADFIQVYVDYCLDLQGDNMIEVKVDLSPWAKDTWGYADFINICEVSTKERVLNVIDLKYGYMRVYAYENEQGKGYALGAVNDLEWIYGRFDKVRIHIVQPRLDHIDTFDIERDDLMAWADNVLKPGIIASDSPDAPFNPGPYQCAFCNASARCKANAEHSLDPLLKFVRSQGYGDVITNQDIAHYLQYKDAVKKHLTRMEELGKSEILAGREVPGFKLVEGRKHRIWEDSDEVIDQLGNMGYLEEFDVLEPAKLISPSKMEKLIGKDNPIMLHSYKPKGDPQLAPLSDKRPALAETHQSDFNEVEEANSNE